MKKINTLLQHFSKIKIAMLKFKFYFDITKKRLRVYIKNNLNNLILQSYVIGLIEENKQLMLHKI